jgi:Zn-dependent protease
MNGLFIERAIQDPFHFTAWAVLLIFSICMHEFAHAWAALKLGDDTAARMGHLTLNPMKQMGPWSLLMFAVAGIAWGSVPVNPSRIRGYSKGEAMVAAAGPLTNLWLSFTFLMLFMIGARFHTGQEASPPALHLFALGAYLNMALCLFNLMPVPPLDGWTVIKAFFRPLRMLNPQSVAQFANIALMVVLFSGIGSFVFGFALKVVIWFLPMESQWLFMQAIGRF